MNTKLLIGMLGVLIVVGCSDRTLPETNRWKGTISSKTKGAIEVDLYLDFPQHEGMISLPSIIPVPLDVTEVNQQGDSVFFTVNFRSGPGECSGVLHGDTITGIMQKEGMDDSPIELIKVNDDPLVGFVKPPKDEPVVVNTFNNTPTEQRTKAALLRLLDQYDLEPYLYTKEIMVQDSVIPHSHPVLTVNTNDTTDLLVLSTLLHEQMHWYSLYLEEKSETFISTMKERYPEVPTSLPEGGHSEESTYLHLLVNYLEYEALRRVTGVEQAEEVMKHWTTHHYTWIYKTVLEDYAQLNELALSLGIDFS